MKGRLGAAEDAVRSRARERDTAARKLETGLLAAYNEVWGRLWSEAVMWLCKGQEGLCVWRGGWTR